MSADTAAAPSVNQPPSPPEHRVNTGAAEEEIEKRERGRGEKRERQGMGKERKGVRESGKERER